MDTLGTKTRKALAVILVAVIALVPSIVWAQGSVELNKIGITRSSQIVVKDLPSHTSSVEVRLGVANASGNLLSPSDYTFSFSDTASSMAMHTTSQNGQTLVVYVSNGIDELPMDADGKFNVGTVSIGGTNTVTLQVYSIESRDTDDNPNTAEGVDGAPLSEVEFTGDDDPNPPGPDEPGNNENENNGGNPNTNVNENNGGNPNTNVNENNGGNPNTNVNENNGGNPNTNVNENNGGDSNTNVNENNGGPDDPALGEFTVRANVVGDNAHGTVSPTIATIKRGQAVTFTFTPDEGYQVTFLTYQGRRAAYSRTTFTIPNVTEDVNLSVEFGRIGGGGPGDDNTNNGNNGNFNNGGGNSNVNISGGGDNTRNSGTYGSNGTKLSQTGDSNQFVIGGCLIAASLAAVVLAILVFSRRSNAKHSHSKKDDE